jgi:hypothetical protein
VQQAIERTRRYWYVDGLSEIGAGCVICLMASFYALLGLLPPESRFAPFLEMGQIMVVLTGYWAAGRAVKTMKTRLTYPRTGYVSFPTRRGKRAAWLALASLGIGLGIAFMVIWLGGKLPDNLVPAVTGALIALALVFLGYRSGVPRFYLVAGFTLLLGWVTSSLALVEPWSNVMFFGGFGLAWIVSGAVTLYLYLRSTRPVDEGGAG